MNPRPANTITLAHPEGTLMQMLQLSARWALFHLAGSYLRIEAADPHKPTRASSSVE